MLASLPQVQQIYVVAFKPAQGLAAERTQINFGEGRAGVTLIFIIKMLILIMGLEGVTKMIGWRR
jgi:hypothetical protein